MDVNQFLNGTERASLPELCAALGRFTVIPVAERQLEGLHASLHKALRGKPHHSPAHAALQMHLPELMEALESDGHFLSQLAEACMKARSPLDAARAAGFGMHPTVQRLLRQHHFCERTVNKKYGRLLQDIMYRADAATMYAALPHLLQPAVVAPALPRRRDVFQDVEMPAGEERLLAYARLFFKEEAMREEDLSSILYTLGNPQDGVDVSATTMSSPPWLSSVSSDAGPLTFTSELESMEFQPPQPHAGRDVTDKMFAFKIVHAAPTRMKSEVALFSSTEMVIASMDVLMCRHVNDNERFLLVSSSARTFEALHSGPSSNVVLLPSCLSLQELRTLHRWRLQNIEHSYAWIPPHDVHGYSEVSMVLKSLLACKATDAEHPLVLTSSPQPLPYVLGSGPAPHGIDEAGRQERVLHLLLSRGLVRHEQRGNLSAFSLTDIGLASMQTHRRAVLTRKVLNGRVGVAVPDLSTYELLLRLAADGWEENICRRRSEGPNHVYTHGAEQKVWCSLRGAKQVNRHYLIALLLAEQHGKPVPPFQTVAFYKALVEGRAYIPRGARRLDGILPEIDLQAPAVQRQHARVPRQPQPAYENREEDINDAGVDLDSADDNDRIDDNAELDNGDNGSDNNNESNNDNELAGGSDDNAHIDGSNRNNENNEEEEEEDSSRNGRESAGIQNQSSSDHASSESSDSTSTSSSASSSTNSNDEQGAADPQDPAADVAQADPPEVGEGGAAPEGAGARGWMKRDESFRWRGFRFTYLPVTAASNDGFEVFCPYHSQRGATACRRSRRAKRGEDVPLLVRQLKEWCLAAPTFVPNDRPGHVKFKPPDHVRSEADLDRAALLSIDDWRGQHA